MKKIAILLLSTMTFTCFAACDNQARAAAKGVYEASRIDNIRKVGSMLLGTRLLEETDGYLDIEVSYATDDENTYRVGVERDGTSCNIVSVTRTSGDL